MGIHMVCAWQLRRGWEGRINWLMLYSRFGTTTLILQLMPVLSMFFLLTSAAGTALWVADLEREKHHQAVAIAEQIDGVGENDEFPQDYTDTDEPV